jgi:hypothetical protein
MVAQIDSIYRQAGIGRTARRLVSYVLFEGRPLTTQGRWWNPFVFTWLRTLAGVPGRGEVRRPVFITGLGRSGTTILGLLLSLNREVGFLNEPKAMWQVLDPRQDINGNYSTHSGRFRLHADDVDEKLRQRANRLYARYLRCVGARRVVDKYPELIFRLDYVQRIFPDALFIFIARNGCDAVHSVAQWSMREGVTRRGAREDWWGSNDCKWTYFREQLLHGDSRYAAVSRIATPELDHVNRAALEWIVTMNEGMDHLDARSDAVVRVSYEDLTEAPVEIVRDLQRRCGLQVDPAVERYAQRALYLNPPKPWPSLHPEVDLLFSHAMTRLGYSAPGLRTAERPVSSQLPIAATYPGAS